MTQYELVRKIENRSVVATLTNPAIINVRTSGRHNPRQIKVETLQFQVEDHGNGFALPTTYGVTVNGTINAFIDRDNEELRRLTVDEARRYVIEHGLILAPDFRDPLAK